MKIQIRWNWRAMLPSAALVAALLLAPYMPAQAQTANTKAEPTRVASANALRVAGIAPEVACEAGSLLDCEELYCRNGINEQCRKHVLQTAKISTDTWYLRRQVMRDGTTAYAIRCMTQPAARDLTIVCAASPGPNRCSTAPKSANSGYPRLDKAAAGYCATG
jgi:hypothetical protein